MNDHLRALDEHGLVELVEERRKGNVTERLLRATAMSYVISPAALDGEIRFASAADRAALAEELAASVTSLVSKYHDEHATRGRDHRSSSTRA